MFRLNRWLFLVVLLATRPTVAQEPTASPETVAELEGQTEGLLEELRSGRREADDLVARYEAADGSCFSEDACSRAADPHGYAETLYPFGELD